jgi:hypothetical protein
VDSNLVAACQVLGVVDELLMNPINFHISCMKCGYVGGKYMHFMTANTPHTHLEFCLYLSKRNELNPVDISKNSNVVIARE